jgi:histidine triad (HIT) family protein
MAHDIAAHADPDCIFCKIIAGQIPSKKLYEDEHLLAFHDIRPAAPTHFLIIPKLHIPSLFEVTAQHGELIGHLLATAPRLAREVGADDGFRSNYNPGRGGGLLVYPLHLHVVAGPRPWKGFAA